MPIATASFGSTPTTCQPTRLDPCRRRSDSRRSPALTGGGQRGCRRGLGRRTSSARPSCGSAGEKTRSPRLSRSMRRRPSLPTTTASGRPARRWIAFITLIRSTGRAIRRYQATDGGPATGRPSSPGRAEWRLRRERPKKRRSRGSTLEFRDQVLSHHRPAAGSQAGSPSTGAATSGSPSELGRCRRDRRRPCGCGRLGRSWCCSS